MRLAVLIALASALACGLSAAGQADESIAPGASRRWQFNRDIRPILSDNCYFCHGPDKNKREANLRLDTREGLHGADDHAGAIVAGQPEASELFRRVTATDPELLMPPPASGKQLTPGQIQILREWIAQGGDFEGHWAFLPIGQAEQAQADSDLEARQRIDAWIAEGWAQHGLQGAPPADPVTLLRRLHFDLTGLPPTPQAVQRFLQDHSPTAYERTVDELLSSPHFGERLAMWWLDLVRYADSVGYHGDQEVSVSPFRDYVIRSFNENKPFDQFTREQLAGDLFPEPTREQLIASGYNRLGMMSAEGGVQDKEYLAKYMAERVRNASGTWLGVTLGCCECHDHKFDPFPTRDFYRFAAFFADIKERGLYAGANSDGNWGPSIKVPTPDEEAALAKLNEQLAMLRDVLNTQTEALAAEQAAWEASRPKWTVLAPAKFESAGGATLHLQPDQSLLASGNNPPQETYQLTFSNIPAGTTALRLEVLPDPSLPQQGPGRAGNGNFVLTEFVARVRTAAGETRPVTFQQASATYEQTGATGANPYKKWAVAAAIDGDKQGGTWGWAVLEKVGLRHVAVFETAADLQLAEGELLEVSLLQNLDNPGHNIGRFRLAATTHPRPVAAQEAVPENVSAILQLTRDERSPAQQAELASYFRGIAPSLQPVRDQFAQLEQQAQQLNGQIVTTLITVAVPPRTVRVLHRGNWMDTTGEEVHPGLPELLAGTPASDRPLNRLDLANWLVSTENPLTARALVNRLWKIYFGAGLSRSVDDLGAQGEWPSHPELLDYLANRLRSTGWDLKRLIKTIVLTEAYRQSSTATPQQLELDPYNRWLARQGRFRLDAELVRDNALAVSGLLVPQIGGRSVRPYQPPGYWAYLNFPQREWQNGVGDELYRRGLYTHWQRQYLQPSLLAFDAPSREECTPDRARSNTPLQALVLLNDPSYVEAARGFAELIMQQEGDLPARLEFAFQRALSRPVQPAEAEILQQLWQAQFSEFGNDQAAARSLLTVGARPVPEGLPLPELAAWTSVARAILNLHEFITRY
jgi:hypothetical protein